MGIGKRLTFFYLIAVLMIILGGCSSVSTSTGNQPEGKKTSDTKETKNTPKQGGELSVGYYSDASSFDPILASSGGDESLLYFVYDRLINYGPNFEPLPALAESWEQKDNQTLILHLRKGVTFHDGTPFNAEAVKFNIERINSDKSNKADLKIIETVEVIDEHTVGLHLNTPYMGLLEVLMGPSGMMVSPDAVKKYGDEYALHPVGTGPFKMTKRTPNSEIQFERFNDYWDEGKPYLDKINVKVLLQENTMINALKSGEVQIIAPISAANLPALEKSPNISIDASSSLNYQNIFINTSMAPLDNKDVRLAIQYAIDREQLVKAIQFGKGEPAYSPFSKDHPVYTANSVIQHDVTKAKQLLKDSGVKDLSFDMLVKPDAFSVRVGEAVTLQLKEVGINVNLKPTEVTKLVQLAFGQPQYPATVARAAARPDPLSLLNLYYGKSSYYNPGRNNNPEFESLIQQAAGKSDNTERNKLLAEATVKIMQEDAAAIPLFFEPMIVAMSDKVKGYEPHQYGKPRFPFLWLEK
ncbi:ABC transporter substrate-binding protein [Bacillus sp. FJAT-50051]|nr:ABC transporter substrate-binding protein [Neobacillus citreus]